MPRRMVMNESAKWRSGRAAVLTGVIFFSGRGGKSAGLFRANEGVAAQDN